MIGSQSRSDGAGARRIMSGMGIVGGHGRWPGRGA